jgi:hypothetical protein
MCQFLTLEIPQVNTRRMYLSTFLMVIQIAHSHSSDQGVLYGKLLSILMLA